MTRDDSARRGTWVIVLVVGLTVMAGCTSGGRALDDQRLPAELLGPESVEMIQDSQLSGALDAAGVNVAGAPADAVAMAGAIFCGATIAPAGSSATDAEEASNAAVRGCLLDAQAAQSPAVLVDVGTTTEGDPIVVVWRVLSDGTVAVFTDASRDSFGPASKGWDIQRCSSLETKNATLGFTIPGNRFYCA
jgi:hypothetical protein